MPITLDLTDDELAQLREFTQQDDPVAAVRTAMSEFIRHSLRMQLLQMPGNVDFVDNWRELEDAELKDQ
jgi:hypothetical protein